LLLLLQKNAVFALPVSGEALIFLHDEW